MEGRTEDSISCKMQVSSPAANKIFKVVFPSLEIQYFRRNAFKFRIVDKNTFLSPLVEIFPAKPAWTGKRALIVNYPNICIHRLDRIDKSMLSLKHNGRWDHGLAYRMSLLEREQGG